MCNVEVDSCPLLVLLTDPSTWDLREIVMQLMMEGGGQSETPLKSGLRSAVDQENH